MCRKGYHWRNNDVRGDSGDGGSCRRREFCTKRKQCGRWGLTAHAWSDFYGESFSLLSICCKRFDALGGSRTAMVQCGRDRTSTIEAQLRSSLQPAADMEGVADVRVRGAIGVIEMKDPMDSAAVTYRCRELGAWLRPFGRLLYTMPPFVIQSDELETIMTAMLTLANEAS